MFKKPHCAQYLIIICYVQCAYNITALYVDAKRHIFNKKKNDKMPALRLNANLERGVERCAIFIGGCRFTNLGKYCH